MSEAPPDALPPPPICVFCNAPWTDEMLVVFTDATMESGYYGDYYLTHTDIVIDVTCTSCKRLVYRKECRTFGESGHSQEKGPYG